MGLELFDSPDLIHNFSIIDTQTSSFDENVDTCVGRRIENPQPLTTKWQ